ncbi:MAG: tetratricopeptide repeat protein [Armatimonadota bacterium]
MTDPLAIAPRPLLLAAVCSAVSLALCTPLPAQESAAALYERGDYAAAVGAFERELATAGPSSGLLYNLGNACFRAGRAGEAILYYERAARLAPRDPDVQDNLALARLATVDRFVEPPRPWPLSLIARLHRGLTAGELATAATGLFWLLCFAVAGRCAAVAPRWRRATGIGAVAVAILLLLAAATLGDKLYGEAYLEHAIVLADEAELRSGPGDSFASTLTLHEGAKLGLGQRRGVWVEVTTQAGGEGWVRASQVEGI